MSYTMTMDMPKRESMFVQRSPQLRRELSAIFLAVVTARMQYEADVARKPLAQREDGQSVSQKLESFVRGLPKLKGRPYRFRRADAYDEALA